jgi:hypothetical protein
MWKECVNNEKNGESQILQYSEEFRDPDGQVNVGISGLLSGDL